MLKLLSASCALFFIISLNSCIPSSRLYYFYDKTPGKDTLDTVIQKSAQKIQKNDRLSITISSTDPLLTAYLNPFNAQQAAGNATQQASSGYLVNNEGKIEFPLLGQVQLEGLSTVEAATLIKDSLSRLYKNLFVSVNLRGQVYFINGRTGTPIPMINERLTLFEAIAQSGTQDPYDKKYDVWLIREKNGERTYAKLNLNSKKIFQSPYYYLQNNDLLYVQPSRFSTFLGTNGPTRSIISVSATVLAAILALRNF